MFNINVFYLYFQVRGSGKQTRSHRDIELKFRLNEIKSRITTKCLNIRFINIELVVRERF